MRSRRQRREEQISLSGDFSFGGDGSVSVAGRQEPVAHLRRLDPLADESPSTLAPRRDAMFRRSLALADVIAAAAALFIAQAVTVGGSYPFAIYLGIPLVVFVGKVVGLYDRDELVIGKTSLAEAPAIFQLTTLSTLLVVLLSGIGSDDPIDATTALALWALLFFAILAGRKVARQIVMASSTPERCLMLGAPDEAFRVDQKLSAHGSLHAKIVASLPFEEFELRRPRDGDFGTYVAERGIDRVIVGQCESRKRMLETVRYFKDYELKVSVLPDLLEVVGSSVEFDEIHGTTLLGIRRFGLSRSSAFLKRSLDIAGSILLLVVLAPVLGAIAIAVRLGSPGPVLFRQTRVGHGGTRFTMFKFRTMFDGSDQLRDELAELNQTDGLFKLADDPRVTGAGSILRRSSLDELPQLINVLRGEMSLVGPRPLIIEEDAKVEGYQRRRLHLKPGMTGAWQIMGQARVPLEEMVSMDYLYIVNWSLWSDVRILLETLGHVLGRRGL